MAKFDYSILKNYEIIKDYFMKDTQSDAALLRHKKSGAYLAVLSNDDDNKVFDICFRTPVSDDTGVPHIIEHTVLCGSKKYPVKDPFIELAKGSLNTFLNAMTYPDKTVYPVASCNGKDFKNLVNIYMDAVFCPRIYNEEKIFKQEGWHFELDSRDSELTYNGVVYNEMKGAYSSIDGVMDREVLASLYPDTGYSKSSGGDPQFIPDLTYENYLNFHRKYYHPSNSLIYLYGDMDVIEYLKYFDDEYLSKYEYSEPDSEITLQVPFDDTVVRYGAIPLSDGESEENKGIISYNLVVGTVLDKYLYRAMQVIDYALMEMPGAPLKQAILDAGIGSDVYSIYENGINQPFYSFVARNADPADSDKLKEVVDNKIKEIIENKIDKKTLEAAINNMEFAYREKDFGRYPKGLIIGLSMLDSWLYDKNEPFMHIEADETFEYLRQMMDTDYYEEILKKYFVENRHRSIVVLNPEKGLDQKKEEELKEKLAGLKASLSDEELDEIIKATAELKEYQNTHSTPEELKVIPMISIDDIEREPREIRAERKDICGIEAVHHNYFTSGIGYLSLVFKNGNIPEELIPYLSLLKQTLSYMDTEKYDYKELNNEINIHTGAIVFDNVSHSKRDGSYVSTTEVNVKALFDKMPKAFELLDTILFETDFSDEKRLLEIIREIKSKMKNVILSSGNSLAALRAFSYYSEKSYFEEQYAGVSFYKFIEKLEKDFDTYKDEVVKKLKLLCEYLFRPENLIISYTCEAKDYFGIEKQIEQLKSRLYTGPIDSSVLNSDQKLKFVPEKKNEGLMIPSQVQYVVKVGKFSNGNGKMRGELLVLRNLLSYEYLWNKVRELGGAYGCGASFGVDGNSLFSSYRDPKLGETLKVYDSIPEYIEEFDADEDAMTKLIIGTISGMDAPLTPADAGARSFGMYITETTMDMLRETRLGVLTANVDSIKSCKKTVEEILSDSYICVIGNEAKIEKNKELFGSIKHVFES